MHQLIRAARRTLKARSTRRQRALSSSALAVLCTASAAAAQSPATDSAAAGDSVRPRLVAVEVHGLIDIDFVTGASQPSPPNRGFGIRRARITTDVRRAGLAARLIVDPSVLANGANAAPFRGVPLIEAYVEYGRQNGTLVARVGQQRVPFATLAVTGAPTLPTPEFTQFARHVLLRPSSSRDIGIAVLARRGPFDGAVGVFGGAGINVVADNDSSYDVVGRVAWRAVRGVRLAASAWTGHTGPLATPPPGTPPVRAFYDDADFVRVAADVELERGPWRVLAEHMRDRVRRSVWAVNPAPDAAVLRRGSSVTATIRPRSGPPALQRVELVGRYDRWNPGTGEPRPATTEYVGGITLWSRGARRGAPAPRVMAFVERTMPDAGAPATRLHARWEVVF